MHNEIVHMNSHSKYNICDGALESLLYFVLHIKIITLELNPKLVYFMFD